MSEDPNFLDSDFADYVQKLLDKHHVPGIGVAVIHKGKVYSEGYGYARLPDTRATADTLWFSGSTTKSMIAVVEGKLVHDPSLITSQNPVKDLKWTTPIVDVLGDDFQLADPYMTANVTLEDALSHRSGLPGHDNNYGGWMGHSPRDITKTLRYLGNQKTPIRTVWAYNNLMYAVSGDIIETLTGMEIGQALQKFIWQPLGMKSTFWGLDEVKNKADDSQREKMARGYFWFKTDEHTDGKVTNSETDSNGHYLPVIYMDLATIKAAGTTVSSVNDYAKYVTELLRAAQKPSDDADDDSKSKPSYETVITHKLFQDLTTPRMLITPTLNWTPDVIPVPENHWLNPSWYALAWFNSQNMFPGIDIVCHSGGLHGFGTEMYLVPGSDFGVVTMGNTGGTANLVGVTLAKELIGRMLGKSLDERRPKEKTKEDEKEQKSQSPAIQEKSEVVVTKDVITEGTTEPEPSMEPVDKEGMINQNSTGKGTEELERYPGTYNNKAYGPYKVTLDKSSTASYTVPNPTLKGYTMYRKKPESKTNKTSLPQNELQKSEPEKQIGNGGPVFSVESIGHRTWAGTMFLLHPTDEPQPSSSSSSSPVARFLKFEKISSQGDLSLDYLAGSFPSGIGDKDSEKYPCSDVPIWESTDMISRGACFMVDADTKKMKMGLVLVRQNLEAQRDAKKEKGKDGEAEEEELEKGWQDNLIWFEREEDKE